jgi:hypothetical protein
MTGSIVCAFDFGLSRRYTVAARLCSETHAVCTSCAYFCLSCSLLLPLQLLLCALLHMQAYPYISKRLLTDESPRLRAALRYMIYGNSNVFDVERLIDLLQAFESFAEIRDDKVTFFLQMTALAVAHYRT